jgi:hypothetical protein
MKNIELKAKINNFKNLRQLLKKAGAMHEGITIPQAEDEHSKVIVLLKIFKLPKIRGSYSNLLISKNNPHS